MNIISSYESFKRETEFINRQEDVFFENAMVTFSRRTGGGFEYCVSAGISYAAIEDYTDVEGNKIKSLDTSSPGYIISAEISRDITGDLIVFTQWRIYLRGHSLFLRFDEAGGDKLDDDINLRSDALEIALLGARQWYPLTAYGALKFSYIEDRYKYTDLLMARSRTNRERVSIITPLAGIKYNIFCNISLRCEALLGFGMGEEGFSGAINFEF